MLKNLFTIGKSFGWAVGSDALMRRKATRWAPRWPMSSASTAYTGTRRISGDRRPLSRKACMKAESSPRSNDRFLGVRPPAMYRPPRGIHLSAATPASAPYAAANVSIVSLQSSQCAMPTTFCECLEMNLPFISPAASIAACTSGTTFDGNFPEKNSYMVASPGPEMTRSTLTRCLPPNLLFMNSRSSTSSALRGAQSPCPPSDA
mmetsp:Transcript_32840/g.65355  ORF Transcript_32840/g.65355 Transcript_32840/m.65355 type:complete len:205 (+) Transcript_32840:324-938(+)